MSNVGGWRGLKKALVCMSTISATIKDGGTLHKHKLDRLKAAVCSLDRQKGSLGYDSCVSLLEECSRLKALSEGKKMHAHVANSPFSHSNQVNNLLINMYAKCECLVDARVLFENMVERDVVSWNIIISAYNRQGRSREALFLFERMRHEGFTPNKVTIVIILNACADLAALQEGEAICSDAIRTGFTSDAVVGTAIFKMYAKCGKIDEAFEVFSNMPDRDVVAWNAMIAAYANNGDWKQALQLFRRMHEDGMRPNAVTFLSLLNAFAGPTALSFGKIAHAYAADSGFESECAVGNALISMYARCGSMADAEAVFAKMSKRDVVSWTAMIMGYANEGKINSALKLFSKMQHMGIHPNRITFLSLLNSCTGPEALAEGRFIHACVRNMGFEHDFAIRNALLSMYGKCRSLNDARAAFDKMSQRDVATWNSMISAYVQSGNLKAALRLFDQMAQEGVDFDRITLASILDICTSMHYLSKGKQIHACLVKTEFESDLFVGTALLHFYAECGSLDLVQRIFNKMHERDVVSWTAIIAAHSRHGVFRNALHLFGQMQQEGFKPNSVSFIGILSACSHSGLVDECYHYYISLLTDHNGSPTAEHLGCMIDVLARAGRLSEAEDLIQNMPVQPDAVIWMTLLGACSLHGDVDRGLRAAKHLFEMDPGNTATYVALSNMFAKAQKWEDVLRLRRTAADKLPRKRSGCIPMEIQSKLPQVAGDEAHWFLTA